MKKPWITKQFDYARVDFQEVDGKLQPTKAEFYSEDGVLAEFGAVLRDRPIVEVYDSGLENHRRLLIERDRARNS